MTGECWTRWLMPSGTRRHAGLHHCRDPNGALIDLGFASEKWRKRSATRPPGLPGAHFEAMRVLHLADELRTGDIAVAGAGEYADWNAATAGLGPGRGEAAGVSGGGRSGRGGATRALFDAAAFRQQLFDMLTDTAAGADAGYPNNDDLRIDPKTGDSPTLKPPGGEHLGGRNWSS